MTPALRHARTSALDIAYEESGAPDGAPYDEKAGSVTTALGTDAAILRAGQELAGN